MREGISKSHWRFAATIDESLRDFESQFNSLLTHELRPRRYSRKKLFEAMARQEPILFCDHPIRHNIDEFFLAADDPARAVKSLFGKSRKTLTKAGPSQKRLYQPIHRVVDTWERDRATLSANDVFFRDLKLDRRFDCSTISDFNVLLSATSEIRDLEVATLLMGTTGCMTDSHSDDPDGCNHSVVGRKLWLVWDRLEGQAVGLQDTSYDDVYTQASFDLRSFMSLESSRWFFVSKGLTLFLPGHLTHKVITVEKYLGISSFYVGIVNAIHSLSRWRLRGTEMVTGPFSDEIARLVLRYMKRIARGSRQDKHRWGFYHLGDALDAWRNRTTSAQRMMLRSDPLFAELESAMHLYASSIGKARSSWRVPF